MGHGKISYDFISGAAATTYHIARTPFMMPTSIKKGYNDMKGYLGIKQEVSTAKDIGYGFGIGLGALIFFGELGVTIDSIVDNTPVWWGTLAATNFVDLVYEIPKFLRKRSALDNPVQEKVMP